MKMKFDHVMQFKIALKDIKPPVWRRIQVPCTDSFWDLHIAIQDAMGWMDCHLHEFVFSSQTENTCIRIGIPDEDDYLSLRPVLPGWEIPIAGVFSLMLRKIEYVYDFGDDWRHTVTLEKIFPKPKDSNYPVCVGGKRACPPEDCGGISGYYHLLEVLSNPQHELHEDMITWMGGSFDPEQFDYKSVKFDDPEERWHRAFN